MNVLRSCLVSKIPKSSLYPQYSLRTISTTSVRDKALQNFKRPSIEEIGVPKESWKRVYERNQKKYNRQLLIGVLTAGLSIGVVGATVNFNATPSFLYDVKYKTVLPVIEKTEEDEALDTDSAIINELTIEEEEQVGELIEEPVIETKVEEVTSAPEPVVDEVVAEPVPEEVIAEPIAEEIKTEVITDPPVVQEETPVEEIKTEEVITDPPVVQEETPVEETKTEEVITDPPVVQEETPVEEIKTEEVITEPSPVVEEVIPEPPAVVEEASPEPVAEPEAVVEQVVEPVVEQVSVEEESGPAPVLPTIVLEPLPESVPYLLVGAGTAAFAACRSIKSRDPTAKILIIGDEARLPYMRPPLSKELWFVNDQQSKEDLMFKQWNGKERSLYFKNQPFYTPINELEESSKGGISVATGRKVVKIDTVAQVAHLEDGAQVKYEKCLLATGGKPKSPTFLSSASDEIKEHVTLFRNVADFYKLDKIVDSAKSVTILGGGFLGSELACAFGQRAKIGELEVFQAYQENGNMAKVLPEYLSEWTTSKVQSEGVTTVPNSRIKNITKNSEGRLLLDLSNKTIETDHVVVAYGIEPDSGLAEASGIKVDAEHGGFLVNEQFEACPNLWVAGDAASFLDPQLGRRRVEHHDHAVVSGRLAGENMTGADKAYTHQSMFWSDLGPEVGYEAIGIVDSKLPTVGVFAKATDLDTPKAVVTKSDEFDRSKSEEQATVVTPTVTEPQADGQDYGKGIIFYLKEEKIVGMVLWNVFNRMNIARRVLKEGKNYEDLTEVAKLFNIHSNE